MDIIKKVSRTSGMSFRETIDPKILTQNFKSEIEMMEKQLQQSKDIEIKLTELVHHVYGKLEMSFSPQDPEIKLLNRQLREILSFRDSAMK